MLRPRPVRGRHARELALALGVAVFLVEARTKAPSLLALAVPTFLCALLLAGLLRGLDDDNDGERNRWLRRATALTFIAHLALSLAISSASALVETLGGDA
ncbi:MAG: hypothetical protein ABIV94_06590, partial [Acidimicrobiales bacterium]